MVVPADDRREPITPEQEQLALLALSLAARPMGHVTARKLGTLIDGDLPGVDEAVSWLAARRLAPDRCLLPMIFRRVFNIARSPTGPGIDDLDLTTLYLAIGHEVGLDLVEARNAANALSGATQGLVADHAAVDDPGPIPHGPGDLPPPPPRPGEIGLAATGEWTPRDAPLPIEGGPKSPEEKFIETATKVLGIAKEMVGSALCSDEQKIEGTANGYRVVSSWYSDRSIHSLKKWTDPRNWPGCQHKVFFKDMVVESYDEKTGSKNGWYADMEEIVELVPGQPIHTRLHFDHAEKGSYKDDDDSPVMSIYTTYEFAHPIDEEGELMIDNGVVMLRKLDEPVDGKKTLVTLSKDFEFRSEAYHDWPTLACDTFFAEIAIIMSTNCSDLPN